MSADPPTADLPADLPTGLPEASGLKAAAVGLLVLLLAVLWAGLFYHLSSQRRLELEHASRDIESLGRVYAAQMQGMFSAVDQVLLLLKRSRERHASDPDLSFPVSQNFPLAGLDIHVQVAGPDGMTEATAGKSAYVGDQDYFLAHVTQNTGEMFIGKPDVSNATGGPLLAFSRRINRPDGSFDGIVALTLNPSAMHAALASEGRDDGVTMAVVGMDHVIRIIAGRMPRVFGVVGEHLIAPRLLAARDAMPSGTAMWQNPFDQQFRIVTWRTLADYPVFVVATRFQDEVLLPFNRSRAALIAATSAISAVFILAALLLMRIFDQRNAAMASMIVSRAGLLEAQRLGKIGHWVSDLERGRVVFSDECYKMMGREPTPDLPTENALSAFHPDDLPRYLAVRDSGGGDVEVRVVQPDGGTRWVHLRIRPRYNSTGKRIGLFGVVQDITERKLAEEALRASEERYQLLVDGSGEGMFDRDVASGTIWFSERAHRLLGLPDGTLNGDRSAFLARIHPDDRTAWEGELARLMAAHEPYNAGTIRIRHADGAWRWVATRGRIVYGADGAAVRVVGSVGDITVRKNAEAALLESNQLLLETQRLGRLGSVLWDCATGRVHWSDSMFAMLSVPRRDFFTQAESLDFVFPEDRASYSAERDRAIAERRTFTCDCRMTRADGGVAWAHVVGRPRFDEAGTLTNVHLVLRDYTDIREAELALRASEERYALAIEGMREGLFDRDVRSNTIWLSRHVHELLGVPNGSLNGDRARWLALIHPDDFPAYDEMFERVVAARERYNTSSFRMRRSDGAWRWIVYRGLVLYDDAGAPVRVVGSIGDITEQKVAEAALRERDQQLRAIMDNAPVEIFLKDRDRRYLLVNQEYAKALGLPVEEIIGHTDAEISPAMATLSSASDEAVLEHGRTQRIERTPMKARPGFEHIEILKFPIFATDGSIHGLAGFTFNVTERRRIEDQLRQAAKMEAVGRLASGIVHDFNNMIGAITGFTSFLLEDLPPETPQRRFAARIAQVCEHAKDVVKQVLAFTRAAEVERHVVDLSALVAKDEPLLQTAVSAETRLTVDPGPDPLPIRINEGQAHQILLNLCLNASDALVGPGTVSVRLARIDAAHADRLDFAGTAEPGQAVAIGGRLDPMQSYVAIRVADTGAGMDQATLDRIFEPFFTTKGPTRGTGLGLAVIHGIVTGYDGAYRVTSRIGDGSEFSIYLPLAEAAEPVAPRERVGDAQRGSESILLVDDDVDMTEMMSIGLERLGYEVTSSNDPIEAMRAFEEDPGAWDAVVTDQTMPGMTGVELAERIKRIRPDCPVVLYTGVADRAVSGARNAPAADTILLKPIEPRRVAEHIRALLDRQAAAVAGADA